MNRSVDQLDLGEHEVEAIEMEALETLRQVTVQPVDVRETMARLPGFLQPFLTWLTGKPLPGQQPFIRHTPTSQTVIAAISMVTGVVVSAFPLVLGGWWLLAIPVGWVLTVHAARKLQISICHAAVHSAFFSTRERDHLFIEIVSTLLFIQDADAYRSDHRETHHGKALATLDDPDVQLMLSLGIAPAESVQRLWLRLLLNIFSPRYHLLFLQARFKSNFVDCPPYRRLMSVAYHAAVLLALAVTGAWIPFLVVWGIPMLLLYHVSAILQFSCEHYWLRVRQPDESAKIHLARLTTGRFMGEPAPPPGLPFHQALARWSWWTFKMLTFHTLCRLFVVVSDLPAHDWHHRYPASREWPNALYERQRDIEQGGSRNWRLPYSEMWGLDNILHSVFQLFSELPPVEELERRQMSVDQAATALRSM